MLTVRLHRFSRVESDRRLSIVRVIAREVHLFRVGPCRANGRQNVRGYGLAPLRLMIAMNLLVLRKYAIDHRVEIRFSNPGAAHECLINNKGQVKIPGEEKDFRIEDVFNAAEKFVIVSDRGAQHLTREAMARTMADAMEKKGSHEADEEDE